LAPELVKTQSSRREEVLTAGRGGEEGLWIDFDSNAARTITETRDTLVNHCEKDRERKINAQLDPPTTSRNSVTSDPSAAVVVVTGAKVSMLVAEPDLGRSKMVAT
jgi:hypothetical protein